MDKDRATPAKTIKRARQSVEPNVMLDANEGAPDGPAAIVSAKPAVTPDSIESIEMQGVSAALENKIRQRRAEALVLKGEAYGLAAQLESLKGEYELKQGELQRAWEMAQRKLRGLAAAIEADEATLALLLGSK